MPKQKQKNHVPVLLQEVIDMLQPKEGENYLDLTAGYGGHASEILSITKGNATLVDRDENAVDELKRLFKRKEVRVMHSDFFSASKQLAVDKESYDMILADLGISSPHIDKPERGFSFMTDGPLDMRMDNRQQLTAAEIVNTYDEQELIQILREYGEEPKAKRIARLLVENRPFMTTYQLAKTVAKAWPGYSRTHPATRTFQAIRIAVNSELDQLKQSMPIWVKLLKPGGRLAIISFHSLEDVLVKQYFKELGGDRYDAELSIINKRPLTASPNELVLNPRARSARLRVAAKIKIKRKGT
jgi:16S rRNA (cytosine1402-N4)-methyltransferase